MSRIEDYISNKIKNKRIISIIGLNKNAGKTTVLNKIIKILWQNTCIGITSIGIDGEEVDHVTNMPKPRIYIKKGTLIATAYNCLKKCDITKEILKTTGIVTPLGEVIILRALSDGFVEIAGPSSVSQIEYIATMLLGYGTEKVFIDGALNRQSLGSPRLCDSVILTIGGADSTQIERVVENATNAVNKLSIHELKDKSIYDVINANDFNSKAVIIKNNGEIINPNISKSSSNLKDILDFLDNDSKYIYIKGIITNTSIESILKNIGNKKNIIKGISIIVDDGTKLFLSSVNHKLINKLQINIYALKSIEILFVAANPTSYAGTNFDKNIFAKKISDATMHTVVDVVGGEYIEYVKPR